MKLVKMKIYREPKGGGTHYEYPKPYYDKTKVKMIIYEKGAKERGENYQYIIIGVVNDALANFLKADGYVKDGFKFEAKEITREEAIADGEIWAPQSNKIVDNSKVISILAKVARNEELTQKEQDAIDPEKSERGINRSKSFTETLDEGLANRKWD